MRLNALGDGKAAYNYIIIRKKGTLLNLPGRLGGREVIAMYVPDKLSVEVPCMPGEVFYGVQPRCSPKLIRKYTVASLIVSDEYGIEIVCKETSMYSGKVVESRMLASFRAKEFLDIMFRTKEDAQIAYPDLAEEVP